MRRVVITGMGIVSCLGNDKDTVINALREGTSGIRYQESYAEMGFRSLVAGSIDLDVTDFIDRKPLRFMGNAAAYGHIAMERAIQDAGLESAEVQSTRTGIVAGSGGGSSANQVDAADILRSRGVKKVGPYMVPRTMTSTLSACLATPFHIRGINYSLCSACATSAHCIGHGAELIQSGKQDIVFAGGGEEEHWALTMLFDAMGALSSKYNDAPGTASRPFDATRDGFVIAGGGGMVVLEELEHAKARGARIYGELVGYGATSDGHDMVAPSGEGAQRCMEMALSTVQGDIDYINAHGTSTPVGDVAELGAIQRVFGDRIPHISSTKSLAGHSLGATGVHEAIFSLLMMQEGFLAASANITELDEKAQGLPIVTQRLDNQQIQRVMSNSFGFGGTNATLVLQRYTD